MQRKNFTGLAIAFITLALNYGSRGCFGLFLKPFAEQFGASRAAISSILSVNMLTYCTMAFFTGYLVDRFGPKSILLAGAVLGTVSFIISSSATSLVQVTLSFGIIFGVATTFLGQITSLSLMIKGRSEADSLTLGLAGGGPGFGNLLLSPIMGAVITYAGWRSAMQGVGWLFLGYLILPLFFLQKDIKKSIPIQRKRDMNWGNMVSQKRNLLLLFASFLLMCTAIYGVLSQEAAYATDQGISLTKAALALGLISGIGVIACPLLGWISDHVESKKKLGALILIIAMAGIFFIFIARSGLILALGSIIVGTAYASYVPILPSITRNLFGNDLFGRAWGFISTGGSIGAALGSWLGGYVHDIRGNYHLVWLIFSLCFLTASVTLLLLDTDVIDRQNRFSQRSPILKSPHQ